jgi:hypothetical protein
MSNKKHTENKLTFHTLRRERRTTIWLNKAELVVLKSLIKGGKILSFSIYSTSSTKLKVNVIFSEKILGKKITQELNN